MTASHPLPPDVMAYLDGEMSADEARAVQAHVATCSACQQLAADLRDSSRQMHEWQVEGAPPSLMAPDVSRIRTTQLPLRSRAWSMLRGRYAVAAAAVLLVVAGAIALQPTQKRLVSTLPIATAAMEKPDTIEFESALANRPGRRIEGNLQGQQGLAASAVDAVPVQSGSRIVRTATLRIVATNFGGVRAAIDRILQGSGGFVGGITASDRPGTTRSIRGMLRIPSARFDATLAALRSLGRVTDDSQGAEDVTSTVVDLDVRIVNARATEKRLSEVLQNRTGRLADVLEVEREIMRVRTEIEQMESQRKQLDGRIEYATLTLEVVEERAATVNLGPIPIPTRFRHAIADGIGSAAMSMLEATLFVLRRGPAVLLWVTVLGLPAWWLVRRSARMIQRPGGV